MRRSIRSPRNSVASELTYSRSSHYFIAAWPKSHWMSTVAENPAQDFGKGPEIFHYCSAGP